MVPTAAFVFVGINAGLGLFQFGLALGAPWGRLAWGGSHERLPPRLRLGSAIAIGLYVLFCLVVLIRAGFIFPEANAGWAGPATWAIAAFLALGALGNLASRSVPERLVMTPLAAVLAICAAIVAPGL